MTSIDAPALAAPGHRWCQGWRAATVPEPRLGKVVVGCAHQGRCAVGSWCAWPGPDDLRDVAQAMGTGAGDAQVTVRRPGIVPPYRLFP